MDPLTRQQQRVLDFLRSHLRRQGMPPTRAEIAENLGFRTANSAEFHLKALARKGYVELLPGRNRNIRLLLDEASDGIPLIGRVAAGSPLLAAENVEDYYPCAGLFSPLAHYLLKVQGDSMRDAHIYDGDLLGVHKTSQARSGQIVVARLDDEVTVKTLATDNRGIRLLPANPIYPPLEVDPRRHSFAIEGIAVGTIRRFL